MEQRAMNNQRLKTRQGRTYLVIAAAVFGGFPMLSAANNAGANPNAIIGSGSQAIIGSGKNAIIGSGSQAIIGSGKDAIIDAERFDKTFDVVLIGPIDSIDQENGSMTVLGQTISINESTQLAEVENGQMVAVSGMAFDKGYIASSVVGLPTAYVPGVTKVFLSGIVSEIRLEVGQLTIGGIQVDLNALDSNMKHNVKIGDYVRFSGSQPQPDGVLLGRDMSM
jgi:hypothetical protein